MKKSVWIFLLAVLLPSVVLGWLALRSAGEQQIILERRTAELYQKETENAAAAVRALIDEERRAFNETVRRLLAADKAQKVGNDFAVELEKAWPRKAIGFCIAGNGIMCSPPQQLAKTNPNWQKFLVDNGSFLTGTTPAAVYSVSGDDLAKPDQLRKSKGGDGGYNNAALNSGNLIGNDNNRYVQGGKMQQVEPQQKLQGQQGSIQQTLPPEVLKQQQAPVPGTAQQQVAVPQIDNASPAQGAGNEPPVQAEGNKQELQMRNVAPQRMLDDSNRVAWSGLNPAIADFRVLTTGTDEGVITRFVQDHLEIIFWLRPAQSPDMLFGCLINAENLRDLWAAALPEQTSSSSFDSRWRNQEPEFILALLDDKTRPVATQPSTSNGRDWKRPFVASEIGEALPHWEAALYLQRPEKLKESARVVRLTLIFLIAAALAVIAIGGWLVAADVRRQLALAQQKTDFVSNVSHELKTPLTSIRMFAELMQNGRGESAAKHPQYLRIIMVEAERLTRLINNVLDFARLERKQKQFDKRPLDLHAVVEHTWEGLEFHL